MNATKQKKYLTSEAILRYLIGEDDKIDTLIMCESSEVEILTSDFEIYEALGSIKPYDSFKLNKLTKLFETVKIISYEDNTRKPKNILTDKRVEELRERALKKE